MKKYVDMAVEFGKNYGDLLVAGVSGALVNDRLLGSYDLFGNHELAVGLTIWGVTTLTPVVMGDSYRGLRNAGAFCFSGILGYERPDIDGKLPFSTLMSLAFISQGEYHMRTRKQDAEKIPNGNSSGV